MNYLPWTEKYDKNLIFWGGCPHIQHVNICKATSKWPNGGIRDFSSLDEMNETIIENTIKIVPATPKAILIWLGDFLFGDKKKLQYWLSRLAPRRIYAIGGNHDDFIRFKVEYQNLFDWWGEYLEIRVEGQLICHSHYPMMVWRDSHKGSWMLHSHCHGSLPDDPNQKRCDIGYDTSYSQYGVTKKFEPYTFNDLQKIMSKKNWKAMDHHNKETN